MVYLTLNIVVELICFLIALVYLRGLKEWRLQILYLFLICFIEILGRYLIKGLHFINNSWLYNIFLLVEAFFIALMFYELLKHKLKHIKVFVGVFAVIFLTAYGYDLFLHGFMDFNDQCNSIVSVCYCVMGLYYFYQLMNDEEYINILRFAPFWWVTGTLVYYFGSTVLNIFHDVLIAAKDHHLRRYLMMFLNVFLYSCWSYSFMLKRWNTKK